MTNCNTKCQYFISEGPSNARKSFTDIVNEHPRFWNIVYKRTFDETAFNYFVVRKGVPWQYFPIIVDSPVIGRLHQAIYLEVFSMIGWRQCGGLSSVSSRQGSQAACVLWTLLVKNGNICWQSDGGNYMNSTAKPEGLVRCRRVGTCSSDKKNQVRFSVFLSHISLDLLTYLGLNFLPIEEYRFFNIFPLICFSCWKTSFFLFFLFIWDAGQYHQIDIFLFHIVSVHISCNCFDYYFVAWLQIFFLSSDLWAV